MIKKPFCYILETHTNNKKVLGMITNELTIINLFFKVDEFCKVFIPVWNKYLIESNKKHYKSRVDTLSESELITIEILYQLSAYKNFKEFYNNPSRAF